MLILRFLCFVLAYCCFVGFVVFCCEIIIFSLKASAHLELQCLMFYLVKRLFVKGFRGTVINSDKQIIKQY